MDQKQFIKQLTAEIDNFFKALSTDSGDWVVKGFIWMNYLTKDVARAIDSPIPFHNLEEYWIWKKRGKNK